MKKALIAIMVGLFLLTGCAHFNEQQIEIYEPELPEVCKTSNYWAYINGNGDLYTWGYDSHNAGERTAFYAGSSLGQSVNVLYNNVPTKIYSGTAYVLSGNRGFTRNGEIIEWGKRMENDPCVPQVTKQGVAKAGIALYLTQKGELYTIPESENTMLSTTYENSGELVMTDVRDFAIGYKWLALKNDGSVWAFQASSMTTKIVEKPKKLIDGVQKMFVSLASDAAVLFLKDDGTLWTFGGNEFGQCGNGEHGDLDTSTQDCVVTQPYKLAENVIDAWASTLTTYYLTGDNKLYACGRNLYDMFLSGGNSQMIKKDYPEYFTTPVLVMEDVKQINYGDGGIFVLKTDDTLWTWGYSDKGALGNGVHYGGDLSSENFMLRLYQTDEALFSQPSQIMEDVRRILTGTTGLHFAQKTDGSVWYWGYGEIHADEDDDWDTKLEKSDLEGNTIFIYQKHYIIPTPIEFSIDTYFQTALDYIAAREGIDVAQYEAARYKDQ